MELSNSPQERDLIVTQGNVSEEMNQVHHLRFMYLFMVACRATIHGFREPSWHTMCILLKMGVVVQSITHFIDLWYHMDYSEVKWPNLCCSL